MAPVTAWKPVAPSAAFRLPRERLPRREGKRHLLTVADGVGRDGAVGAQGGALDLPVAQAVASPLKSEAQNVIMLPALGAGSKPFGAAHGVVCAFAFLLGNYGGTSMWHWDQGRLEYFQFGSIRKIAEFVCSHDFKNASRALLQETTGMSFSAPDTHSPWRNYSRVLKLLMLDYEQNGVSRPTKIEIGRAHV